MKTMKLLICALLLFVCVEGITFLPTEFVPLTFLEYSAGQGFALRFDLCSAEQYSNCLFEAQLNSPFGSWNVPNGIYIKFSILGGDNCNTVLCSNDINSKSPQNCSFYLDPSAGSVLYMVSQAGNSAEIPSTFSLRINCLAKGNSSVSNFTGGCPRNYLNTRKNIKLSEPGVVKTNATGPVIYQFLACPSTSPTTDFTFVLTANDQISAFSSYLCPASTCNVASSPPGFYDTSASGFNFVSQPSISGTLITAAIYGWGQYGAENHFSLNVQIEDSS